MRKLCCVFLVLFVFGSVVSGVPLADSLETNEIPSESEFINSLNKCAIKSETSEIASCATERIVRSLDKLSAQQNLEILPGVLLLGDSSVSNFRSGKQLKQEIEEAKANDSSMLEVIGNATARLFAGRTLKVKLPTSEAIGRALEEGRKRMGGGGGGGFKNKGNSMMKGLMGLGGALAAMLPLFLGKIALIATKALIVAKIALVIGGILLFQMFMRPSHNHHSTDSSWNLAPQTAYGPPANSYGPPATSYGVPSSQYPYSRSFTVENDNAQDLAYSAQRK